jgi:hypothetical protein
MNVDSATASALSAIATQRVGDAIGVSVLRKALDIHAAGALALIQALPTAASANLPAHLGQNVNTTA